MVSTKNTSAMDMTVACSHKLAEFLGGGKRGVRTELRHLRRQLRQRLFRRVAPPRHLLMQARQMQVEPLVENRVDEGETNRAAEIAHEVEQARRIFEAFQGGVVPSAVVVTGIMMSIERDPTQKFAGPEARKNPNRSVTKATPGRFRQRSR